jgi:hypothetical protein
MKLLKRTFIAKCTIRDHPSVFDLHFNDTTLLEKRIASF